MLCAVLVVLCAVAPFCYFHSFDPDWSVHFELAQCSFSTIKYIIKFSLLFPFGSLLIKINSIRTELRNKFKSTHAERYAYTHSLMHAHSYIYIYEKAFVPSSKSFDIVQKFKEPKNGTITQPIKGWSICTPSESYSRIQQRKSFYFSLVSLLYLKNTHNNKNSKWNMSKWNRK